MLGHGGENVNCQLVGERHVGGNELDAPFHEPRDKGYVAGEPVQFGYDKPRFEPLTGERSSKLRPVAALAALHLHEFVGELPLTAVAEIEHSLALRFKAEAALSLPVGRDAKVTNPFAAVSRHIVFLQYRAVASKPCMQRKAWSLAPLSSPLAARGPLRNQI